MAAYIQIYILLNAYCIYARIGPITAIVYECMVIAYTQGYPQRMSLQGRVYAIYTIRLLIFTIPCTTVNMFVSMSNN